MSNKLNGCCDICGKKYEICRTCQHISAFKPWRTVTDTEEHYKIFLVLSDYTNTGNKAEAKKLLKECDLTGLEHFNEHIKKAINEIMKDDNTSVIKLADTASEDVKSQKITTDDSAADVILKQKNKDKRKWR